MATTRPINTDLLAQLLPGAGVQAAADVPPTAPAASNAEALAGIGHMVLALIPFAVTALVIYGIGMGSIYVLRQSGANVLPQPWWGTFIYGAMASLLAGRTWQPKK